MPFNRKPQKFNAAIKSVVIGSGDKTVTLGGENVLPFYAFDGEIKQQLWKVQISSAFVWQAETRTV